MRVKFRVIGAIFLASLVVATVADEETLNGADSNTISVLDPRKLTRSSSNINAAAINSLTGSSPSADGKSNETTLIFATHVTEPDAPQLETHPELNNQLGQTVYLQAQPPQPGQHHQHPQQGPPPPQQHPHHHHAGPFLYPQPAPVQSSGLGHQGVPLNAPGASPPYLFNPGYGVQYVQYVPRPVAMPNYPPPPSVYGQNPSQYSNVPPTHHHSHNYHSHTPGFPQSSPYILPPPPAHHTFPSSINGYNPSQNGPLHQSQPQSSSLHHHHHQHQPQQQHNHQQQPHHPQTHFLAGPSPQSQPVAPASTYASGSAVGQPSVQSPQPQLHSHQAQATSQPSSYLTYSSPSHHYHSSQPQVHHHHITHQSPSPTAQATSLIPSHVQAPQQQQQQLSLQGPQQQQLIGSYSHQAPFYSYVQPQQQGVRYGGPNDPFLNTNEYLPQTQYDPSQYRPIKRNSKA